MTKPASPRLADAGPGTSELRDRIAITDLIYRLGACLDEHRFDDLHGLFTEDATASTPGGTARGRSAVIAQATRNHVPDERFQHAITDVLVDLDGDRAAVRANLVATFIRDASRPYLTLGAVYRFRARRTGQGWQLAGLEVDPMWRLTSE